MTAAVLTHVVYVITTGPAVLVSSTPIESTAMREGGGDPNSEYECADRDNENSAEFPFGITSTREPRACRCRYGSWLRNHHQNFLKHWPAFTAFRTAQLITRVEPTESLLTWTTNACPFRQPAFQNALPLLSFP